MLEHYRQATGLDTDVILEKLLPPSDMYLSAEEALELGICDFISDLKK
jgi:ATP-dependent protease ClpP protease subunit